MFFFSLRCSIMYCNGRGHRCALGARKNKSTVCLSVCPSGCPSVCLSVCLCLSVYEKYSNERLPGGTSPTFTPLVLEHFGHWGSAAEIFLAKKSRDSGGNTKYAEFKNIWKKRILVALQRCYGRVILKKVSRLSHGKNTPDYLFACGIHCHVH